jgi:virginiamycin B lyase
MHRSRPLLRRLLTAGTAVVLTLPVVGVVATTSTAHADDRVEAPTTDLVRSVEVTTVTPRRVAPRAQRPSAGGVRAYPVPTSAADLRRITTAPDGSMWFAEGDKNKIGRITTSGVITEYNLFAQTSAGSLVKDIEVDASGLVWVVWDSGWKISRINPGTLTAYTWSLSYPYGEEVRVGPGGTTWVTLSYDVDGILRIVGDNASWAANAPECDNALGRGRDGFMWCQDFDKLIRVNTDGAGGAALPLPADATYPYSVATGPNNKIWFGRDTGGSMFSSPAWGNVGWIDNANQAHVIRTGDRTAPRSLVTGRDGNVWFTSVGAAKGIGHVNASGQGAIVQVGNYRPTSVTYGADGALWFTDSDNNSIVRVPRDHLWVTNVNVGGRSQLRPHPQPRATAAKKVDADKRRKKATVAVTCGAGLVPCSGSVVVKLGRKTLGTGRYAAAPGRRATAVVTLKAAARTQLKRKAKVKVLLVLTSATGQRVTRKGLLIR